ncbi:hypothetical protein DFJ58DRAFT_748560 [Suillus subalutaceus]|uniref:uncharacterized protein n=1 Tax=Suillus subalutaceus TaxID=48586 RepID=UPI001B861513|nr:uncharacterized protein DFJ58DRAFT_748560 [Suillus subalutaceus]KAG1841025.1 hypothetical protein DFJ58DRAFT_748560 [Suillus subalutaceus]
MTLGSLQAQQIVLVTIASFTVLCWDHIITFEDEVDLIWCKPKGFVVYLFLLVREPPSDASENTFYFNFKNRYVTPLGFVINIVGELSSRIIGHSSLKYIVSVDPPHLVYRGCRPATRIPARGLTIPGLLFLVWVALEAYAMARGEMVSITQQVHSCREIHDFPLTLSAARAWIPLAYDSALFTMTLWITVPLIRSKGAGLRLLYEGALYYPVIFSANLVLTVMIVRAPPGQKGVAAQSVYLLTVVMTSRVTLNLKKQMGSPVVYTSGDQTRNYSMHSPTLSKSAASLEPRQTPNLQLQSQHLTVISCPPMSVVSMDADLMDDTQSLEDRLQNRTYADVESQ